MIAALAAPSSTSVASLSVNGVQVRETVVLTITTVLLVALAVIVVAGVWLAARRRVVNARARETIELIQTPADAWRCMGTLESMLPAARPVTECADASEAVVQCDTAISPMKEPVVVAPEQGQGVSCHELEDMDITSINLDVSKPIDAADESTRLSWVEDAATAPLWASLRRDESSNDESDRSKGVFQALAAR